MKTENLTPKEQAEKLVRKYYTFGLNNTAQSFSWYECKECALIAVDELIEQQKSMADFLWSEIGYLIAPPVFWEQVKQELTKQQEQ